MKKPFSITILSVIAVVIFASSYGCNRKKITHALPPQGTVTDLPAEELLYSNDSIAIYKMDSILFFKLQASHPVSQDTLPYLSDYATAKALLQGRVIFGGYNQETGAIDSSINGEMIYALKSTKGPDILAHEQPYYWDMAFSRYYPTEDILVCEEGHSSDFSFDLKHAVIGPERVGNPAYIRASPTEKYRLNGWFPGQECSDYFIQIKKDNHYELYTRLPMDLTKEGFDLCTLQEEFWVDDHTLLFRNHYFGVSDERLGFFRLVIKP